MTNDAVSAAILETLAPMFDRAERNGLWFFSPYQQLWFSPAQLKAEHAKGRFIWGPVNWQLRMPHERVEAAQIAAETV